MFITRLISGVVLVAIALLTIITGGPLLFVTVLLLSFIGTFELFRACGLTEDFKKPDTLLLATYGAILLYYLSLLRAEFFALPAIIAGLILLLVVYVFSYPKYRAGQIMTAFFALVYVAVMLSYIYQARMIEGGRFHVWLIFLASWGCDTCAYCIGMLFGKHKMAPVLSPKKSTEGAAGGVVGAMLLGIIYALATGGPVIAYLVICGIGAIISMVGDLAASAIKRNMDIKDYGRLIPGHGGILDRFDSVIFVAPVIYYLSLILI